MFAEEKMIWAVSIFGGLCVMAVVYGLVGLYYGLKAIWAERKR